LVVAAVYLLWNVAVKDAYHAVTVVFAFSLTMGFDIPAPIVVVLGGFLSYLFFLIKLSAN
jgi:chromate transport protein ChrA